MNSFRGRLLHNEPMARHCAWRSGGPAQQFFEPADLDDLAAFLRTLDVDEEVHFLGLGSNVLIRDGGLRGTVVSTSPGLSDISWVDERRMRVACGTSCAKIAREAAKRLLGGGSFFAGIPGTIGGALAMNAGAFGGETWTLVESVELLDRQGRSRRVEAQAFETGYRSVQLAANCWFVSAVLRFDEQPRPNESSIKELLAARAASQPTGRASCGSVFKNPSNDHAGRLIEAAGLKGLRVGGCHVSEKHANFIINDANATSTDIEALIRLVRSKISDQFGVVLEPEVRIIGEPDEDHPT